MCKRINTTIIHHVEKPKQAKVKKGKDYILLDDFITTGAELRDLRDYISDLRRYGIASEIGCLTISEAAKLNRMVNRKRERQTTTVLERFSSLRQEQSSVPPMAKEIPENEGRRQVSLPHPVTQPLSIRR